MSWIIRQRGTSKKSSPRTTASCKFSNPITIKLMPPNKPFKHSRRRSLLPLQQLIVIFPFNCGIDLPRKSRTSSTCCGLRALTHPKWHTRYYMARMIGTVIPLPHLGARLLSTRMVTHEDHGHPAALMLSIWAQQKIITDATNITFPKRKLTISPDPRSCFHNIASCHP
jgi:hypothetical protein